MTKSAYRGHIVGEKSWVYRMVKNTETEVRLSRLESLLSTRRSFFGFGLASKSPREFTNDNSDFTLLANDPPQGTSTEIAYSGQISAPRQIEVPHGHTYKPPEVPHRLVEDGIITAQSEKANPTLIAEFNPEFQNTVATSDQSDAPSDAPCEGADASMMHKRIHKAIDFSNILNDLRNNQSSDSPISVVSNGITDQIMATFDYGLAIYKQYALVAEDHLKDLGMTTHHSVEASGGSHTRLKKETVTHNGSCGANSCVVGFCIAVLENNLDPDAHDFTKLVTSWNCTYPNDAVTGSHELFGKIKAHLDGGNTADMEALLSPVVRVYYALALEILKNKPNLAGQTAPLLSDDINYTWDTSVLTEETYTSLRESVGQAALQTVQQSIENPAFSLRDITNPLSFGSYLDQSELEIITKELLNINFMRATQLDAKFEQIIDIDEKIKTNQQVIETALARVLVDGELSGKTDTDPQVIAEALQADGVDVAYYKICTNDAAYTAWQNLKHEVRMRWISDHYESLTSKFREAEASAEAKDLLLISQPVQTSAIKLSQQ